MSKFTPIDEAEYRARNVWPAGWYSATISDAPDGCIERLSSNGNMMFETNFIVYNDEGKHRTVKAYILAEGKAAFQLRSAAEAFGVLDEYRAGSLGEDDLKGKSAFVKLGTQSDPNGTYPDKNVILDYKMTLPGKVSASDVKASMPKEKPSKEKTEQVIDDSVPF